MFTGKLVKISRYGESFWLRDVRRIENDIWAGTVDNHLGAGNLFQFGDLAPFASVEVREAMDYPKPKLAVV